MLPSTEASGHLEKTKLVGIVPNYLTTQPNVSNESRILDPFVQARSVQRTGAYVLGVRYIPNAVGMV
jgi:hypothetical protein